MYEIFQKYKIKTRLDLNVLNINKKSLQNRVSAEVPTNVILKNQPHVLKIYQQSQINLQFINYFKICPQRILIKNFSKKKYFRHPKKYTKKVPKWVMCMKKYYSSQKKRKIKQSNCKKMPKKEFVAT